MRIFVKILVIGIFIIPLVGRAQAVLFQSAKTSYRVGDSFQVSVMLDTKGKPVNTISGAVSVPTDKFQIFDVRYGSSIVSLWVERPVINAAAGTIAFTGGIPGGYNGSSGPILSFGLKAKATGQSALAFDGIKILLNDGMGTEAVNVTAGKLALLISAALPAPKTEEKTAPLPAEGQYTPPPDTTPPENFMPMVSRHPSVGDNRYFVSFFAVDKDSGIARYEIEERPWLIEKLTRALNGAPQAAESPHILQQQWWASRVMVRAFDQAGNPREAEAFKNFHPIVIVALGAAWTALIVGAARWYFTRRLSIRKMARRK